jgi:hypothetical protein
VLIATLGAILCLPLARSVAPHLDVLPAAARLPSPALPLFDDPVFAGGVSFAASAPAAPAGESLD